MRGALERRLSSYWKLEAANVLLVPGLGVWAIHELGDALSWPVIVAMAATAALLVVGAFAWRMELAAIRGERALAQKLLPWLSLAQAPTLLLTIAAVGGAGYEVWRDGGATPSAFAAVIYALLAVLEYVNYYVVQLQHFDHAADLKRLMSGRGFREAHLAKALRRWRKARRA